MKTDNGSFGQVPALVFLVSVGLAFATGTSWGTMGIILPIVVGIGLDETMTVISISAASYVLAGFVKNAAICLPVSFAVLLVTLFVIKNLTKDKKTA